MDEHPFLLFEKRDRESPFELVILSESNMNILYSFLKRERGNLLLSW